MNAQPPTTVRSVSALVLVSCVLGVAMHARAQVSDAGTANERPLGELLKLDAGATCLEADRLALRIARWRERDTVDARIRVAVQGDASSATRVAFTVTAGGASASRTLSDAPTDCDQLHSAVALAIALSIDATLMDPRARQEAALPLPEVAPEPEPKPALIPALHPSEPTARARQAMHLDLHVAAGPSVRVLRTTTLALAPRVMFSPLSWLAIVLSGYATHATGLSVGTTPGTVDSTLALGGLDLCARGSPIDRLDLRGCLGARAGAIFHRGEGFTPNFHSTEGWYAASGSVLVAAWVARSVAVGAVVEGLVPLRKYVLLVSGVRGASDQTTSLPGFGFNVAIGPVFRFF